MTRRFTQGMAGVSGNFSDRKAFRDDDLIGTQKHTFCWGLDIGIREFAEIRNVYATKFGVFQNQTGKLQVARHLKEIPPEVIFERIKSFIISVAQKAATCDLDGPVKLAATPAKTRCWLWHFVRELQDVGSRADAADAKRKRTMRPPAIFSGLETVGRSAERMELEL